MRATLAVLVAASTLVVAGSAGATMFVKDQPPWAEAPSVADVAAAFPARAKAANISGMAQLSCSIGHDNRPRDCTVLKETGNYGFGSAARKLAAKLKVDRDGLYGQVVFIPFTFDAAVLSGSATVTKATWANQPALEDFQATFPMSANGVNHVRVVLGCTVASDGELNGCAVNSEDPAGQGYGAGALALAPKFRLEPWGPDGQPMVGAHINLPIRYELTPVSK